MQWEVQSSARRDWIWQSREDAEMTVRGMVHGSSAQSEVVLEHEKVVRDWIETMRVGFADIVVRHTHKSVDNEGRQLFDLPPLRENNLLLQLYEHEYENLEEIADSMMGKDSAKGTRFAEGNVRNIFIISFFAFIRCMRPGRMHCNRSYLWALALSSCMRPGRTHCSWLLRVTWIPCGWILVRRSRHNVCEPRDSKGLAALRASGTHVLRTQQFFLQLLIFYLLAEILLERSPCPPASWLQPDDCVPGAGVPRGLSEIAVAKDGRDGQHH